MNRFVPSNLCQERKVRAKQEVIADITLPATFANFGAFEREIEQWAADAHFKYRIDQSNFQERTVLCLDDSCPFKISGSAGFSAGVLEVTVTAWAVHDCEGSVRHPGRAVPALWATEPWLVQHLPEALPITADTTVLAIQLAAKRHFRLSLECNVAARVRNFIAATDLAAQKAEFSQVQTYAERLRTLDPGVYVASLFPSGPETPDRLPRIFVRPSVSADVVTYMRPIVFLGAKLTRTRFVRTVLFAAFLDAENMAGLIAWALVEGENAASWSFLCEHLRVSLPLISADRYAFMAETEEAGSAINQELPNAVRLHCTQEISDGVEARFGSGARSGFDAATAQNSAQGLRRALEKLRSSNSAASRFLARDFELAQWAFGCSAAPTWGNCTCLAIDEVNDQLYVALERPCIQLLDCIWNKQAVTRTIRKSANFSYRPEHRLTSFAAASLQDALAWPAIRDPNTVVDRLSNSMFNVRNPAFGPACRVHLPRPWELQARYPSCTCGHFQEMGIPCRHAATAICHQNANPRDWVASEWTVASLCLTYEALIVGTVDISDLVQPRPEYRAWEFMHQPRSQPSNNIFRVFYRSRRDRSLVECAGAEEAKVQLDAAAEDHAQNPAAAAATDCAHCAAERQAAAKLATWLSERLQAEAAGATLLLEEMRFGFVACGAPIAAVHIAAEAGRAEMERVVAASRRQLDDVLAEHGFNVPAEHVVMAARNRFHFVVLTAWAELIWIHEATGATQRLVTEATAAGERLQAETEHLAAEAVAINARRSVFRNVPSEAAAEGFGRDAYRRVLSEVVTEVSRRRARREAYRLVAIEAAAHAAFCSTNAVAPTPRPRAPRPIPASHGASSRIQAIQQQRASLRGNTGEQPEPAAFRRSSRLELRHRPDKAQTGTTGLGKK